MKVCSKCKISKAVSEFPKDSYTNDGLRHSCKECNRAACRTYRSNNLVKEQIRCRKYREENREQSRAYAKECAKKNPERYQANLDAWRKANPDRCRFHKRTQWNKHKDRLNKERAEAYAKDPTKRERAVKKVDEWRKANPEGYRAQTSLRVARKCNAEGSHTAEEVIALFKFQKGRCAACKASIKKKYHKDHIVPLQPRNGEKAGTNYISNIQLLCTTCNCSKSNKNPIRFMQEMGYLL
jgi:hypothetical protein